MIAVTTDGQFVDRVKSFTAQLTHTWDVGWVQPDLTGASVSF
jgi:hypothetical protein